MSIDRMGKNIQTHIHTARGTKRERERKIPNVNAQRKFSSKSNTNTTTTNSSSTIKSVNDTMISTSFHRNKMCIENNYLKMAFNTLQFQKCNTMCVREGRKYSELTCDNWHLFERYALMLSTLWLAHNNQSVWFGWLADYILMNHVIVMRKTRKSVQWISYSTPSANRATIL